MAKKVKDKPSNKQLAEKVIESAQEIWLAGLAAFDQAQREGNKAFDALVKEGKKIESRTRELADVKLDEVRQKASTTWDRLEEAFEERVVGALKQIGIPSGDDVTKLKDRIDALEKLIKAAGQATGGSEKAGDSGNVDNLKTISGLGDVIERQFNDRGIVSYRQLAQLSDQDIEQMEADGFNVTARLRRDNWIEQAREQHFKKYGEKL